MVHLLIICVGQIVTSSPNVTLFSKYFSLNVFMCSALFIFGRYAEGYPWNRFSAVHMSPKSTDNRWFTVLKWH